MRTWLNRHRKAVLATGGGILVLAAGILTGAAATRSNSDAAPAKAAAWQLNVVQLDNGTCVTNLQLGGDKTASSSATPSFLIYGEGAGAKYDVTVDTTALGTFTTDNFGNTCVPPTSSLADGPHTLTVNEVTPNAVTLTPFRFSVDTVPPPPPSAPKMVPFADTGIPGDNISRFSNNAFTGTATPGVLVQLYAQSGIGGANTDANGNWFIATSTLADQTYTMQARATDSAGNRSAFSPGLRVTIDAKPPTVAFTTPTQATVAGTVPVSVNATDATSGIWKVSFLVDSATKATVTGTPYTYSWDTTGVANGNHTLGAIATDIAGNVASTQLSVTVANGVAAVPTVPTQVNVKRTVAVTWAQPDSDGGSPITAYRVYRGPQGSETFLAELGPNARSYTDDSAPVGVYYQVSAVNAAGESVRSTSG